MTVTIIVIVITNLVSGSENFIHIKIPLNDIRILIMILMMNICVDQYVLNLNKKNAFNNLKFVPIRFRRSMFQQSRF